jgi:hypothetical protein
MGNSIPEYRRVLMSTIDREKYEPQSIVIICLSSEFRDEFDRQHSVRTIRIS